MPPHSVTMKGVPLEGGGGFWGGVGCPPPPRNEIGAGPLLSDCAGPWASSGSPTGTSGPRALKDWLVVCPNSSNACTHCGFSILRTNTTHNSRWPRQTPVAH